MKFAPVGVIQSETELWGAADSLHGKEITVPSSTEKL
jgi:hypothetical protein